MRDTHAAKSLLTPAEQVLYGRLVRAFPGHIILSHVALSRLVSVGFAVCRSDFTPLAAIEIDAADVLQTPQRVRTRRKDQTLQAAGIKVIHVSGGDLPDEAALKALVASHPLHAYTDQLVRRAS